MTNWKELFDSENAWGIQTGIDVRDCDHALITSEEKIKEFAQLLCEKIDMKRFGETQVVHFGAGHTEGFSMVQLIETSLVSGHFANESNRAFVDVFSCKYYDPEVVRDFAKEFFKGRSAVMQVQLRK